MTMARKVINEGNEKSITTHSMMNKRPTNVSVDQNQYISTLVSFTLSDLSN